MKPLRSIVAIVAALAVILGLSVASALREERRLTDDFTAATKRQAHASVEALSDRIDTLDQDTRMLDDLVRSSASEPGDPALRRQVWASAFRALAVVVSQYRAIAMVDRSGEFEVLAVDPTELPATVDALSPHIRDFAREVVARGSKAVGRTVRHDGRSFLLYGTPVSGDRTIVVASDAAIFLGAVPWSPVPAARLFVTDPAGVVWAGCETPRGCRESSGDEDAHVDRPVTPIRSRNGRLPTVRIPEFRVAETIERPTGTWVVTWVASTREILERQRSMIARVVLTAIAAAFAVAVVGAILLHQQRASAELAARLHVAQALAGARETSQAVVESAPLGVLGLSQDGKVVFANRFLTDRLGPVRTGAALEEAFGAALLPWVRELEPLLATSRGDPLGRGPLRSLATGTHEFRVRVVPVWNDDLGVRTLALLEDQSELRNLEQQLVRAEKLITVGVLVGGHRPRDR